MLEILRVVHTGGARAFLTHKEHVLPYAVQEPYALPTFRAKSSVYFSVNAYKEDDKTVAQQNALFARFDKDHEFGAFSGAMDYVNHIHPRYIIDNVGSITCFWVFSEPFVIKTAQDLLIAKSRQVGWFRYIGADYYTNTAPLAIGANKVVKLGTSCHCMTGLDDRIAGKDPYTEFLRRTNAN